MRLRALLLLVIGLLSVPAQAQPDFRPVVLTGAQLPLLVGASLDAPVCYSYDGAAWSQCPLQIDERALIDPGSAYPPSRTVVYGGEPTLLYTRPRSYAVPSATIHVPFDADVTFDANDELVLMARYFGQQAPSGSLPPGGVYPLSEVVYDGKYAYLFRSNTLLDQSAGVRLINYNFSLNKGAFPANYMFGDSGWLKDGLPDGDLLAANPESSVVTTDYYTTSFNERWIQRELRTTTGAGSFGPDLIDRVKYGSRPDRMGDFEGSCSRSEYTASAGAGTLGIQKNGPLRGIRFAQGYNSGPLASVTYFFYEQMVGYQSDHRVHPTRGSTMFFDYSPETAGMQYYSNRFPNGVAIDGVDENPDRQYYSQSYINWDYLLGSQGSLVSRWQALSNLEGITPYSYYEDDTTPEAAQCTGADLAAYASTGNMAIRYGLENGGLPALDPRDERVRDSVRNSGAEFPYVSLRRQVVHRAPGMTPTEAQTMVSQLQALEVVSVNSITPNETTLPVVVGTLTGQLLAGTATEQAPEDVGLAQLRLAAGAANLQLFVNPFFQGATEASFTAQPIDDSQPATGVVEAVDLAGNIGTLAVQIEGRVLQPDVTAPALNGSVSNRVFSGSATEQEADASGLASITLIPGATNLVLTVTPFALGAPSATFSVSLSNVNADGNGVVQATDRAGNVSTIPVAITGEPLLGVRDLSLSATYQFTSGTGGTLTAVVTNIGGEVMNRVRVECKPTNAQCSSSFLDMGRLNPGQSGQVTFTFFNAQSNASVLVKTYERDVRNGERSMADNEVTLALVPTTDLAGPTFSGTLAGHTYTGTVTDQGTNQSGLASIVLAEGSTNLTLTYDPFAAGVGSVAFTVTLTDSQQNGSGSVVATDVAGNTSTLPLSISYTVSPDVLAPLVTGSTANRQFNGTATDNRLTDTGIQNIWLRPGATNLQLTVNSFASGAPQVGFTVRAIKARQPGSGWVMAQDVAGNVDSVFVQTTGSQSRQVAQVESAEGAPASQAVALPDAPTASAYPNPFNPVTQIRFAVPALAGVRLEVFDLLGRQVARLVDENLEAGWYEASFDAAALPSGVYLYRLAIAGDALTGRITLLK